MYINFIREKDELKRLGIKRTFLANEVLSIGDKLFHDRLFKTIPFEDDEIDLMFNYIKSKGYKKSKKYLFAYSGNYENKKIVENNETLLSSILKKRMKEKNITNEKLSELLNVSEDTISNWRCGKIENIRDRDVLKKLCDVLSINVLYLLGLTNNPNEVYISERYESNKLTSDLLFDEYMKLLINYARFCGIDDVNTDKLDSIERQILKDKFDEFMYDELITLATYLNIPFNYFNDKKLENRIEIANKRSEMLDRPFTENEELFKKLKNAKNDEEKEKYKKQIDKNINSVLKIIDEFKDIEDKESSETSKILDELEDDFFNK